MANLVFAPSECEFIPDNMSAFVICPLVFRCVDKISKWDKQLIKEGELEGESSYPKHVPLYKNPKRRR